MHTDCPIHTSDARCVESLRILSSSIQEIYICALDTLDIHLLTSFTVIRRQESSKYNPSQTTPSMLRWFSPLSEVEDCWTTSIVQGSSRQATTTDTIHQSTIEITQWRDYCPSRIDYCPSRMLHWGKGGGGSYKHRPTQNTWLHPLPQTQNTLKSHEPVSQIEP